MIRHIGFGSDSSSTHPNDWWEYDITSNSWSQLAPFQELKGPPCYG